MARLVPVDAGLRCAPYDGDPLRPPTRIRAQNMGTYRAGLRRPAARVRRARPGRGGRLPTGSSIV
jgi:hypothetical protein